MSISCFNLTGVCWTVYGLTFTTCSTVHIHSFHKKYIFVYTAFTLSYNRAVTGTPGFFIFFFFFYLRRRNPFTRRYNAPCTAFPSRRAPPAAWSCRVWVIWPSVSLRFSFSAACLSGLSALVSALRPPACRAGSSRHALVLYSHRHSLCNLLFVLADVLLMSVPLNVIIAHL